MLRLHRPVHRWLALAVVAVVFATAAIAASASPNQRTAGDLTGAGSTFVSKLVQTWIPQVDSALGIKVTYGPIGSGGGINAITNRTVDFGASDAPLTADQFSACKGCVQIPWALSATSIPYRIDGVHTRLRLTGQLLADIFLGKITKWNDPQIKKVNKGVALPNLQIAVVHRSDSSGTSYNFTDYLSQVSPEWKSRVGKGTSVDWPTGTGQKGSAGVSAALSQTNGSIGYVDVAFSLANHLSFAAIRNSAGVYTLPSLRGIAAAASSLKRLRSDNAVSIVNPSRSHKKAYPISTFTWVIVPLQTGKATELKRFVDWALTKGQRSGPKLIFQPIPKVVLRASERTLARIHT